MVLTFIDIVNIRIGNWLVSYDHECDCGCTKKRYTFVIKQDVKPTLEQSNLQIEQDYKNRH